MSDSEDHRGYTVLWDHLQTEADDYLGADDDATFELRDDGVYLLVDGEPQCHWSPDTFADMWRRGRGNASTRRVTKYTLVTSVLLGVVAGLLYALGVITGSMLTGIGVVLALVVFAGIKSWRAHTPSISPSDVSSVTANQHDD